VRTLTITLIAVLGAGLFLIYQKPAPIHEILNSSECSRTCWLGIEPGITTVTELKEILTHAGIEYRSGPGVGSEESFSVFEWAITDTEASVLGLEGEGYSS
jgi:hypothetical protein